MKRKYKGKGFLKKANKFLKDTKLLSSLTKYIPIAGSFISPVVKFVGYGKGGVKGFNYNYKKFRNIKYRKSDDVFKKRNVNLAL